MMEFHDLLAENNMTLVTSVVVTDTTVDFKSLIARLVVSLITVDSEIFVRVKYNPRAMLKSLCRLLISLNHALVAILSVTNMSGYTVL